MSGMIRKPRRLQRIPEMTETITFEINLNTAKHPRICTVKSLEPDAKEMATTGPVSHLSPRSLQLIPTSRQTETETETGSGLMSLPLPATRPRTVPGRAADLRAKRGSSSWPHHTRVEASLVYIQSAISSPFEALREQSRVMLVLKISVAEMGLLATRSKRLLRRGQERLRQKAIDTPNISARPPR